MRLHRYDTYLYISITYCIGMLWCIINININLYVTNHICTVFLDMDINVNNKLGLYKNSHGYYMI